MEYRLTEQQELVKNTISSVFDSLIPDDQIRMELEKNEYPKNKWQKLAEEGWLGILATEDDEFSLIDILSISEASGRKLYKAPLTLVTSYIVPILNQLLSDEEKDQYLHPLVSGEKVMTTILPEFVEGENGEVVIKWDRLNKVMEQDNIMLSGTIQHVPFAQDADYILLPIETVAGLLSIAIIDCKAEGITIHEEKSFDYSRKLATVHFDNVIIKESHLCGNDVDDNRLILEKNLAAYIQSLNSEIIGGSEKILKMTIHYANERKQFGQPIGVFQSIKHKIAEMATVIENVKAYNYQTTWKLVNEPELDLTKSIASRVYTVEIFKQVCEESIQIFGGMGFTWEQDVHFWYKSALYHQSHVAPIRTLKRYIYNHLMSETPIKETVK